MFSYELFTPDKRRIIFERIALGAILLLALVLHFFRLDQEGFANLYYAATVRVC